MKNRKEKIIEATLELAAQNGLGTVSMQQIADKVGITKASLYNHFSSRDEIIDAMYELLRNASRENAAVSEIDYGKLTAGRSMKEILTGAVASYRNMVSDPRMHLFYKIILSQRSIDPTVAEIMVRETRTMINATTALFYALQVKGIAVFPDVDAAAFSFAMGVHSILDYEFDLSFSKARSEKKMMKQYIDEFCRIYAAEK